MQKTLTTQISFTPAEIEAILKEYVLRNTNMQADKVSFSVSTVTTGHGPGERDEKVFTGATLSGLAAIGFHNARSIRKYREVANLGNQIAAIECGSEPGCR